MTGIERLRELAEKHRIIERHLTADTIDGIAHQIEREHVSRIRVLAVVTEMERHLIGHEGMEDSSVARWACELRRALKSDASDADEQQNPSCANPADAADVTSEAAKVTRDPAGDVSMSAYDLLPEDEREAIAWVREHGGLSHVKDIYHDFRAVVERLGIEWSESELHGLMDALDRLLMTDDALRGTIEETCARLGVEHTGDLTQDAQAIWREIGVLRSRLKESVPRAAYERHLARLQRQIDESHAALRRRNALIAELERQRDELRAQVRDLCEAHGIEPGKDPLRAMDEVLDHRLMPWGMEWLVEVWPRFEDGEPVKFGDMALIDGEADMVEAVQLWIHGKPVIYGDGGSRQLDKGERVKRPAPKVLDADGAETRLNDKVYDQDGTEWYVNCIPEPGDPSKIQLRRSVRPRGSRFVAADPQTITHRAPFLAADGKPLREGGTVWDKDGRGPFTVRQLPGDGDPYLSLEKGGTTYYRFADYLTHERPDSYDALWGDIENCAVGYTEFMRRVKALAGGS